PKVTGTTTKHRSDKRDPSHRPQDQPGGEKKHTRPTGLPGRRLRMRYYSGLYLLPFIKPAQSFLPLSTCYQTLECFFVLFLLKRMKSSAP
ncbi:hypothetical protein ANANG_G00054550, partial [Anguilla anguilla]